MNQILDQIHVLFGRAVQALHFKRRTLSADLLWKPLADGWEVNPNSSQYGSTGALTIPYRILQYKAVLSLPNGKPFSKVVETYTRELFEFPAPFSK